MGDYFVVQTGEATLVVGGKMGAGNKTTAPNEMLLPRSTAANATS